MVSFAILSTLIATAAALGINCRGSGYCGINDANLSDVLIQVQQLQAQGKGGKWYPAGVQLACAGGTNAAICAFFQNTSGGTPDQAAGLIQGLLDHGCRQCGSNPTNPGNNVADGELTVNVVGAPCCSGKCVCPN